MTCQRIWTLTLRMIEIQSLHYQKDSSNYSMENGLDGREISREVAQEMAAAGQVGTVTARTQGAS